MGPFDKCGACHSRCSCSSSKGIARCPTSRVSPTRFCASGLSAALSHSLIQTPNHLRSSRSIVSGGGSIELIMYAVARRIAHYVCLISCMAVVPTCEVFSGPDLRSAALSSSLLRFALKQTDHALVDKGRHASRVTRDNSVGMHGSNHGLSRFAARR